MLRSLFRFSIRDLFWLVLVTGILCAWWLHYRSFAMNTGLYSDSEIMALEAENEVGVDGRVYLVVKDGSTMPRRKVFDDLGIDENRLIEFRSYIANLDCTLMWQISPSYDLVCRTALNDPKNRGLTVRDSRRLVYGVEIRERQASEFDP